MTRNLILAAALACSSFATSADAPVVYYLSGNGLAEYMRAYKQWAAGDRQANQGSVGIFVGYVMGVSDSYTALKSHCIPPNAPRGQLATTVIKFMEANPEVWHYSADSIVFAALVAAYPCPR